RVVTAHCQHSQAGAAGCARAGGIRKLWTLRLPSRARRIAQGRGDHPAHRSRAGNVAHPCRFARRNRAAAFARRQRGLGQRARGGCAGQSPAAQDRTQSRKPTVRADRARHRIPAGDHLMTSLDIASGVRTALTRLREAWEWYDAIPPVRKIHSVLGQVADGWRRVSRWLNSFMPKGLYARALLIILAPMV